LIDRIKVVANQTKGSLEDTAQAVILTAQAVKADQE
jgi:hypothetical protein